MPQKVKIPATDRHYGKAARLKARIIKHSPAAAHGTWVYTDLEKVKRALSVILFVFPQHHAGAAKMAVSKGIPVLPPFKNAEMAWPHAKGKFIIHTIHLTCGNKNG